MKLAPTPPNERERLQALESCSILDTPEEPDFDTLTGLAAELTSSPIATISLIDEGREWFKSRVGVEQPEAPRSTSFCGHAMFDPELMVVEDTHQDERFADNPQTFGDSAIRFYAGAPLVSSDGFALGTLCVKDRVPRRLDPEQRSALLGLARQVVAQLELRRKVGQLERESTARQVAERVAADGRERYWRLFHSAPSPIVVSDESGRITDLNPAAERMFGHSRAAAVGMPLAELLVSAGDRRAFKDDLELLTAGDSGQAARTVRALRADGSELPVKFALSIVRSDPLTVVSFVYDLTDRERLERERLERDHWTRTIEGAIDDRRLVLHGQPLIDVRDGGVRSHELLLRMRAEGSDELIAPCRFLPEAERHGLVGDIDNWVVGEALAIAAHQPVTINLSGASIGSWSLLEAIRSGVARHGVEPSNVLFEITETAALEDLSRARRFVQHLVELGFGFALDDFGTGYGSLTHLKNLPVTHVKIDMQFVQGMSSDVSDRRIVDSIVSIASALGMKTIAEGVEDQQTLDLLRIAGVDLAQGYGIERPGPIGVPASLALAA